MLRSRPKALRNLRQHKGHSTRTLAAITGMSHSAIVRLEGGPMPVLPDTAKRLADALGVEITDLAEFDPEAQEVAG